jgi:hypothetical protein
MPVGLDTPSTIGMAATASMGVLKFFMAFGGRALRRLVPQAGLLGSLAGIALMLIGFFPMVELLQVPIVGFLTLGLVLYALVAKGAIPGGLPGVLFAIIVGTLAYYGLGHWALPACILPDRHCRLFASQSRMATPEFCAVLRESRSICR